MFVRPFEFGQNGSGTRHNDRVEGGTQPKAPQ